MPPKHLTTTAEALYRVFILPSITKQPSIRACQRPRIQGQLKAQHPRCFSSTRTPLAKTRAPELRTEKWDEEITSRLIYLVDSETNEIAPQPSTRYDVLNRIDRKTHRLVQVADSVNIKPKDPLDPSEQDGSEEGQQEPSNETLAYKPLFSTPASQSSEQYKQDIPVCKILSKKLHHQLASSRALAAKQKRRTTNITSSVKTLELNWAISSNDLSHRLDKVAEFLAEGRKVEIVLAAKKRGRKATQGECEEVLRRIRSVVGGVEGAREERDMAGKLGGFTTLAFAGRVPKGSLVGVEKES